MNNEWLCVNCGLPLGTVAGGELVPSENVPHANIRTRGPNLVLVCPDCGQVKTFYTSDPIVRAMYQLVDAIATALARRVLSQLSDGTLPKNEKV